MGQALGNIGSNIKNIGNISEANMGDLDAGEKATRGVFGALQGGLQGLNKQQGQQQGGSAPPIGIAPPQAIDMSQIYKKQQNPFWGQ